MDGSTLWTVKEENWDTDRAKMLCRHLGFDAETGAYSAFSRISPGHKMASGDFICYNVHLNETSCCVNLKPFTAKGTVLRMPYVKCKCYV